MYMTLEELREFINSELETPSNPRLVTCRNKYDKKQIRVFIKLPTNITYERPWRGKKEKFEAGDFLSTDTNDIYCIRAETFKKCFTIKRKKKSTNSIEAEAR